MKPCPFCGMKINPDDPDLVYPSGSGWIDEEELGQGYRNDTNQTSGAYRHNDKGRTRGMDR